PGSQWAVGAVLLLRWVDDNANQSSPDQIIGLDNVRVELPPGQLPTVALTSPANGSGYLAGSTISIAATASDADGTIARVEFFADGGKLGEDAVPPYEFAWTVFAAANHTIVARATDNDGNTAWSAPVNVIYPLPPFTLWKIARFGVQIADSSLAGDLANPAGDGIPNLVKYALGLDPFSQGAGGLPELSVSAGVASLTYTRLKSAPDIACAVMWSADLVNWSGDGVIEEPVPDLETATTWRIRARLPGAGGGRLFACLRVSRIATGTNAELSSLQTSAGTLSPAFNPAVASYSVNVENGVSSFALTPVLQDPLAIVTVTGPPSLAVGANTFTIRITAEDGVTDRTHTVVVNRAPPPNPPPPFASSLVLHFETAQGVSTSGGNVTAWNDQSVRQNHLAATGSPRFGLVQTPSGRPAITFNGNGDKLEKVGAPVGLPAGNANRTMFVVVKYNSSTAWAGVAYGTGAPNQAFGLNIKHPTGELGLQGWGSSNDLVSATPGIGAGWLVQSGVLSAGTATLFKNGVQIGQFQHTFNTVLSRLLIGQEMANLGYAGMDLSAVLLYDRALSPAERASVDDYLRIKYLQPPGP
ncbi:MAG: Ig-like domain-containing protein, partial [Chthoniobacteraceae bacterium]